MSKRQMIGATLAVAAAMLVGAGPTQGAANECSIVGSWFGYDQATGLRWLGMHTPSTSATNGQIGITWQVVDPSFNGSFPVATQMTGGSGVWQKVRHRIYRYTWISYGTMLVAPNVVAPVYAMRVSGTATMPTCDHKDITYTAEFFSPDMTTLYDTATGSATEDRMPLVTTP